MELDALPCELDWEGCGVGREKPSFLLDFLFGEAGSLAGGAHLDVGPCESDNRGFPVLADEVQVASFVCEVDVVVYGGCGGHIVVSSDLFVCRFALILEHEFYDVADNPDKSGVSL